MPDTPLDMTRQADHLTLQILGLDDEQRDYELERLQQENEVLHALVRQRIRQLGG